LPYCPNCGKEIQDDYTVCPDCGERLKTPEGERSTRPVEVSAVGHLNMAWRIASAQPMVFAPALLGGVISSIIDNLGGTPFYQTGFSPLHLIAGLISLVGSIAVYILNFASIDMARDAYTEKPLDLGQSMSYVVSRIVTFIGASILSVLLSITIILIPVAVMLSVIVVMDETGVMIAAGRAFNVLITDLGDIIVILLLSIVGYALLGWVPFLGGLLTAALGVVISLAFIDVYYQYRRKVNL